MKNIFRFLMAAVIFFGAVSCAKEDISTSLAGGEVEVTFTANLPELGTRAYGDGANAGILFYNIYEANTENKLDALCGSVESGTNTFKFQVPMIKGMTYDIVLWAQNKDCGYYRLDGKQVTAVYEGKNANDDTRDAFYCFKKNFSPTAPAVVIPLTRPFAQLNVATSDLNLVANSDVEITTTTVKVKTYTGFNIATGDVTGEKSEITFEATNAPFKSNETLKTGYDYLSMNYILVPKEGMTVDPVYTFNNNKGVVFENTSYGNVPLKQNYRTNILGALLTKQTEIEVEILPGFGDPDQDYVMTAADLKEQIENAPAGEQTEIVLGGDIDLNDLAGLLSTRASQPTGCLTIAATKDIVLNLTEGCTLRHTYTQTSPYALIDNYGQLTIKGKGTITYTDNGNGGNWTSSTVWNKGTLVVEGDVTLVNNSSADVATNGYPHVIDNYSALTINGGTLTNNTNYSTIRIWCTTDDDTNVTINGGTFNGCIDFHNPSSAANKGTLTINGGTFNADTYTNCATRLLGFGADVDEMVATINGGTFNGAIALRNWSGSDLNSKVYTIYGGTFSENPSEYLAQGYEAVENNGVWTVKLFVPVAKVGNTEYSDIDKAIAAWTNGSTLSLLANVTLNDVITLASTEHHILNLGTYTMTAASGMNAIEVTCNGRSSASYALTINADSTNPGGITATGKSCIYYKKSDSTKDRPIILINNGVFTGSYSINSTSNGNTNCPQIWINGGVFNSYMNLTKNLLKVTGGTFHGAINCTGDQNAYRHFSGGRFKSWQFMTADAPNKFAVSNTMSKDGSGNWIGTYDVGVYVDDEGYLVIGGPVITEFGDKFAAKATNATKWSSYLKYSSAAEHGLYYTNAELAIKKHGEANVVVK